MRLRKVCKLQMVRKYRDGTGRKRVAGSPIMRFPAMDAEAGGRDLRASGQYPIGLGMKASMLSFVVRFYRWVSYLQMSCAWPGILASG